MTHTVPPSVGLRLAWGEIDDPQSRRTGAHRLLQRLVGDDARLAQVCPRCGGVHGPVQVIGAPLVASVTYAGGLAVVAVADAAAGALGIDAEPLHDPRRDSAGMAGLLGPGTVASVRDWTRLEAALKADGRGLRIDAADVRLRTDAAGWTAAVPGRADPVSGWDLDGPAGLVLSAAVLAVPARRPL